MTLSRFVGSVRIERYMEIESACRQMLADAEVAGTKPPPDTEKDAHFDL